MRKHWNVERVDKNAQASCHTDRKAIQNHTDSQAHSLLVEGHTKYIQTDVSWLSCRANCVGVWIKLRLFLVYIYIYMECNAVQRLSMAITKHALQLWMLIAVKRHFLFFFLLEIEQFCKNHQQTFLFTPSLFSLYRQSDEKWNRRNIWRYIYGDNVKIPTNIYGNFDTKWLLMSQFSESPFSSGPRWAAVILGIRVDWNKIKTWS